MAARAGLAKRRQSSARPLAAAKLRYGHAGAPLSKSDRLLDECHCYPITRIPQQRRQQDEIQSGIDPPAERARRRRRHAPSAGVAAEALSKHPTFPVSQECHRNPTRFAHTRPHEETPRSDRGPPAGHETPRGRQSPRENLKSIFTTKLYALARVWQRLRCCYTHTEGSPLKQLRARCLRGTHAIPSRCSTEIQQCHINSPDRAHGARMRIAAAQRTAQHTVNRVICKSSSASHAQARPAQAEAAPTGAP